MLEIAILTRDDAAVAQWLGKAVVSMREPWEGESIANNLHLITEARQARREGVTTVREVLADLAPGA